LSGLDVVVVAVIVVAVVELIHPSAHLAEYLPASYSLPPSRVEVDEVD